MGRFFSNLRFLLSKTLNSTQLEIWHWYFVFRNMLSVVKRFIISNSRVLAFTRVTRLLARKWHSSSIKDTVTQVILTIFILNLLVWVPKCKVHSCPSAVVGLYWKSVSFYRIFFPMVFNSFGDICLQIMERFRSSWFFPAQLVFRLLSSRNLGNIRLSPIVKSIVLNWFLNYFAQIQWLSLNCFVQCILLIFWTSMKGVVQLWFISASLFWSGFFFKFLVGNTIFKIQRSSIALFPWQLSG